ncbi:MAG: hypothetical protein WD738_00550 [Pirellulales bacterium]
MKRPFITAVVITLVFTIPIFATEPNETFAATTVLSPGVLSVADQLGHFPDTVLGIRDLFGNVYHVDDDSSHLGDGRASGVCIECDGNVVPTNEGSIDFSISGYDDFDFVGSHSQSGYYKVFVNVYDFFDELVDEFSEVRLLQPGVVHDFSYSDFEWIEGYYEVYIDNTVGLDVDFFTFTGLSPGAAFTAQTLDPDEIDIDTYLGWFDENGVLLDADDDSGGGPSGWLSLLEGTVPANGMLTLAVTGFGDDNFAGDHGEFGTYELQLDLDAGLPGDFNGDNSVNAADYVTWRNSGGSVAEYNTWRAHFGETGGSGSTGVADSQTAVPEPASLLLCGIGGILCVALARNGCRAC